MTSVAEHLNNAADHIAAFGHHKGSGFATTTLNGGHRTAPSCMAGALTLVMGCPTSPEIAAVLRQVRSYLGRCPVAWNDDPATTAEQVIEVLRAAAVIEAAKEAAPVEVTA